MTFRGSNLYFSDKQNFAAPVRWWVFHVRNSRNTSVCNNNSENFRNTSIASANRFYNLFLHNSYYVFIHAFNTVAKTKKTLIKLAHCDCNGNEQYHQYNKERNQSRCDRVIFHDFIGRLYFDFHSVPVLNYFGFDVL